MGGYSKTAPHIYGVFSFCLFRNSACVCVCVCVCVCLCVCVCVFSVSQELLDLGCRNIVQTLVMNCFIV